MFAIFRFVDNITQLSTMLKTAKKMQINERLIDKRDETEIKSYKHLSVLIQNLSSTDVGDG